MQEGPWQKHARRSIFCEYNEERRRRCSRGYFFASDMKGEKGAGNREDTLETKREGKDRDLSDLRQRPERTYHQPEKEA